MAKLFETITDISANVETIRNRRYGVIEVTEGKFTAIHFRPWPKLISAAEAQWLGGWHHGRLKKDHCLMYYNQPLGHTNFLALKYTVSSFGTTYKTFRRTCLILDEVAKIKKTDAIVAEVSNTRISDRFIYPLSVIYKWEFILKFIQDIQKINSPIFSICKHIDINRYSVT